MGFKGTVGLIFVSGQSCQISRLLNIEGFLFKILIQMRPYQLMGIFESGYFTPFFRIHRSDTIGLVIMDTAFAKFDFFLCLA